MAAKKTATVTQSTDLNVPPGSSMPLIDLIDGLESHVARLGATPAVYTRPVGWPSRLSVPTLYVVAGRWQPRSVFVDVEINELAESIEQMGIINPLMVFVSEHGKFELIAGERRLRAAAIAKLNMVPVEIIEGTPDQLEALSVVDNLQRQNLTAWEEGAAFEKMIKGQGISEAELARRMGKNRAYIQQRRGLARACAELHTALGAGSITFAMARGIIAGAGDTNSGPNLAAQTAGVAAVLAALKAGKPMDEGKARKLAEAEVEKALLAAIETLGWTVTHHYSGSIYIWAKNARPRVVSSAEMLAITTPPSGIEPAIWEKDDDIIGVLQMRGLTVSTSVWAPWIAVYTSSTSDYTFYSGAEMPEAARRTQLDLDAMERSANDAGWELRQERGSATAFFVKDGQQTGTCYGWADMQKMIQQLCDGRVDTHPRTTCPQCDGYLDTSPWMYYGGSNRIHRSCLTAAQEAERQRILASQPKGIEAPEAVNFPIPSWLLNIPEQTVRALVWMLTEGNEGADETIQDVRESLCVMVEQALADFGDNA